MTDSGLCGGDQIYEGGEQMTAHFPDSGTIRAALSLATMAPSVQNSQPWHWEVGADSLYLYADPSRQIPRTDPDRRDVLLSCGAALHHCTVALAAAGWQTRIHRFPDPAEPNYLANIEVYPQPAAEQDVVLAEAISRRRTDRRNFSSWPVPLGDITLMGARAARAGVMLRQIDLLPKLSAAVAAAVRLHTAEVGPVSELHAWSGRHGSIFGKHHPRQSVEVVSTEDNAVVLALGTESDDDLACLRGGEATSLVLLSATAMGLATCPVTEPLKVPETRESVRADVFGASGYPQMMLRIGWTPIDAEPLPATPRRPLSDAVSGLDDTVLAG